MTRVEIFYRKIENNNIDNLEELEKFLARIVKMQYEKLPLLFFIFNLYPTLLKKVILSFFNLIS